MNDSKNTTFLKKINIGDFIKLRMEEIKIPETRLLAYIKEVNKVEDLYQMKNINTDVLLKLSKILEYDFFRLYSQHLILYAPPSAVKSENSETSKPQKTSKTKLPRFRKNIYTQEVIDFIIGIIKNNEKTVNEVIAEYRIPKTTLYKWLSKYQ